MAETADIRLLFVEAIASPIVVILSVIAGVVLERWVGTYVAWLPTDLGAFIVGIVIVLGWLVI
jgi:hypothetical protein